MVNYEYGTGAISAYRGEDGKMYTSDGMFLLSREEAQIAIRLLQEYVDERTDEEIKEENDRLDYKMHHPVYTGEKPKKKVYKEGYVYLLSCSDKYKIGYSNNVERRVKQLDTRPFPLEIVSKIYSDIAYDVEQEVHRILAQYKIEGEWYKFDGDFTHFNEHCFYRIVKATEAKIYEYKGEI